MKKIVLLLVASVMMLGGFSLYGQGKYGADSAECIKYLSYYKEYYKQKNYDEAIPHWRKAFKLCPPTANQTMIIDGTTLVRQLINKNRSNPIYKESLVDTLMMLHDTRAQYYPKYAVTVRNNKGLDMINYIKDEPKKLYDGLKVIIEQNGAEAKPQFLLFVFNTSCDLYQKGTLTAEDVMNDYQAAMGLIESVNPDSDSEKEQLANIKKDIESLFIASNIANCDNLIALFTPRFEADPDNLELATNIVKMMSTTEGCTDNDLFLNAASTMHRLDPSYTSAYFLYRLYSSKGDIENAVKYMEEAIASPESGNAEDAQYYFELATFCYKNSLSSKAFSYAQEAVKLDQAIAGKAYFLIGTIWGAQVCQGNEIEKRAPYWVAVDYMVKARNADPSLAEEANRLIAQFSAYFPETSEAFMYNITKGESYTVSCGGMKAVTTVKTQD